MRRARGSPLPAVSVDYVVLGIVNGREGVLLEWQFAC
jgi:hypothetical protein